MIIYQAFNTFYDKDFYNLQKRIPYLKELGIDTLLISPIFKSTSTHGYDVTDYYELAFGTKDLFKETLNKLHDNKIKVLLDIPIAHTSGLHPWFIKSVNKDDYYTDYYVWRDNQNDNGLDRKNKGSNLDAFNEWSYREERCQFYRSEFGYSMPNLNVDNHKVRDELKSILTYWLDFGIDGYRFDATSHVYSSDILEFWSDVSTHCRIINPNVFLIGECWESMNHMNNYGKVIGSVFNFDARGINVYRLKDNNLSKLVYEFIQMNDIDGLSPFSGNHDLDRVASLLFNDQFKILASMVLLFTSRGIPALYYGDEQGSLGLLNNGDEDVRKSINIDYNNPIFELTKTLITLRNKYSDILVNGRYVTVWNNDNNCASYIREKDGKTIWVIISSRDETSAELPYGKYKNLIDDSDYEGFDKRTTFKRGFYVLVKESEYRN